MWPHFLIEQEVGCEKSISKEVIMTHVRTVSEKMPGWIQQATITSEQSACGPKTEHQTVIWKKVLSSDLQTCNIACVEWMTQHT